MKLFIFLVFRCKKLVDTVFEMEEYVNECVKDSLLISDTCNNLKTIYNCFQEFTIEITNLLKEENEKISEELEKHENEMEDIKNKYEKVKNSYFNISKGIEKLFSEEENIEGDRNELGMNRKE
ncbi:hypothetical protein CWI37_2137p0010 [Hamiltosporidium tvaerminnensis]|uniref:Uncharacterized protein n=1 Tax=Hamiltosporidium tvaerminnensis TaxID=1176355 RepID=A0A4Q9KT08_9MICR|nr:hypothetical protein CWI37_2137p0010 [Hamiltosporidium tvaerminnensis]